MATFIGTEEEFNKYIGPFCRNDVKSFTKGIKKRLGGVCEFCGEKKELHAAHMSGLERPKIIGQLLQKYKKDDYIYNVNIEHFKDEFQDEHKPVISHFYFLCQQCHDKYHANQITSDLLKKKRKADNILVYTKRDLVDFYKRKEERVQDYIKRLLNNLYNLGFLNQEDIVNLQDKNYCLKTFGLELPWLEKEKDKIKQWGYNRYYVGDKFLGIYYVCSQWHKKNFNKYEQKLTLWINELFKRNGYEKLIIKK